MNQFLYTAGLQEGSDCISKAVSLSDFVFTSLQLGNGETIEEQTYSVIHKTIDALSDLGCELRHVIKYNVYLTNYAYKEVFLSAYKNFVEAPFPTMTILEVNRLENEAKVGMEVFAINTIRYEKGCGNECASCSSDCANN